MTTNNVQNVTQKTKGQREPNKKARWTLEL